MTDQTFLKLRELLLNEFDEAELIALCKEIGIDYASLPGAGTFGKTREILEAARAQDKLRALQRKLRELRPEAYAAAGIGLPVGDNRPEEASLASASTRSTPAQSPIPRFILPLLVLLALVAIAALLLPRLSGQATSANPAPPASGADRSTPAGVVEVVTPAILPTTPPTIAPEATSAVASTADEAMPTIAPSDSGVPQVVTPIAAFPAEATTVAAEATPEAGVVALPVTAPAPLSESEQHPAAQGIRELNNQLPLYFTGQVTAQALEAYLTGEALRAVTGFRDVRLPRAMGIAPAQRSALDVTFEYLRQPATVSESPTGAVVTSREFWRYANTLNTTEICEVRDYVYNMVKDGDRYRVRTFQSRLLEARCPNPS